MKLPPKAASLRYETIKVGDTYSFETKIGAKDVESFIRLTGDLNPLHFDPDYAGQTAFERPIVHGMLLGSLFSRLIGMFCPGGQALYLSQSLQFRKPVYQDQALEVKGTVTQKTDAIKLIVLRTEIFAEGKLVISGEAHAKFLDTPI